MLGHDLTFLLWLGEVFLVQTLVNAVPCDILIEIHEHLRITLALKSGVNLLRRLR